MMRTRRGLVPVGAGCLVILFAAGCESSRRDGTARFVPARQTACDALVAVLEQWKSDQQQSPVRHGAPAIHVIDTHRQPADRLDGYRLLGDNVASDGRRFTVELTWRVPAKVERVRFLIVGDDPLLVFRQEDYDMVTHWDHAMPSEPVVSPPRDDPASHASDQ